MQLLNNSNFAKKSAELRPTQGARCNVCFRSARGPRRWGLTLSQAKQSDCRCQLTTSLSRNYKFTAACIFKTGGHLPSKARLLYKASLVRCKSGTVTVEGERHTHTITLAISQHWPICSRSWFVLDHGNLIQQACFPSWAQSSSYFTFTTTASFNCAIYVSGEAQTGLLFHLTSSGSW